MVIQTKSVLLKLATIFILLIIVGCTSSATTIELPTPIAMAQLSSPTPNFTNPNSLPPTFTPSFAENNSGSSANPNEYNRQATNTPLPIPTNTPITNTPTPGSSPTITSTPTNTATPTNTPTSTRTRRPPTATSIPRSSINNVGGSNQAQSAVSSGNAGKTIRGLSISQYPRPSGDNGWGMHWVPTVNQDRATVDRFMEEVKKMHIKWVVFLNDNGNIGNNDYLVEQLTSNGIMPIMRIYRSNVTPYDGNIGAMVRHYRAKGVYYYQLYNEPNVNGENDQGAPNPNHYARMWSIAAREVAANGGYPGIGALSPGGEYDHYQFLDRTFRAIIRNGDIALLDKAWVSVHNYHGLRQQNDPDGYYLYRQYNRIVLSHLGRSLPIIGTEAGSYHPDPQVEKGQIIWQYEYMRRSENYYFAYSYWLIANQLGGAADDSWEWQSLFRQNWTHPVVEEFFYKTHR